MPSVREFDIIQPPTSQEVLDLALASFRDQETMPLIVMDSVQQVPRPQTENVAIHIMQLLRVRDEASDGWRVVGSDTTHQGLASIISAENPVDRATLEWVTTLPPLHISKDSCA